MVGEGKRSGAGAFALAALWGAWGCASAGERLPPERLRISAADAEREARTAAASWSEEAALRFVEGEGVDSGGYVPPEQGAWRLVYEAAGRSEQLVVTVTPTTMEQVTRPPQSPPGFVLPERPLGTGWLDSPPALAAVRSGGGEAFVTRDDVSVSLLLAPLEPPQWVVRAAGGGEARQWRVNARSGALLGGG